MSVAVAVFLTVSTSIEETKVTTGRTPARVAIKKFQISFLSGMMFTNIFSG